MTDELTRTAASAAVESTGWRYVLGRLLAAVPVSSLDAGLGVAGIAVEACGADADAHLGVDVRPDRVELILSTGGRITARDAELARAISGAVTSAGHALLPPVTGRQRPVQLLEIAIDALDILAIRPFWAAVLGYELEVAPALDVGDLALIDPVGQGPSIWFQQMDEPRPQRNRIHFDIAVPHDEAPARLQAALDAGGVLVSDDHARAFWILADVEGNEICICTWQDRERPYRLARNLAAVRLRPGTS